MANTVANHTSPTMPVTAAYVDTIAAGLTRKAKAEDGRSFEMGQEDLLPVLGCLGNIIMSDPLQ